MAKHLFRKAAEDEWEDLGEEGLKKFLGIENFSEADVVAALEELSSVRGGNLKYEVREVE